jgi:hypothetical protein
VTEPINLPSFSRRRLLAGAAVIGAGLVAAACGSDSNDAVVTTSGTGGSSASTATTGAGTTAMTVADSMSDTSAPVDSMSSDPSVDLKVAGLAAGLEALAVGTYKAALDAAGAGSLGEVPPAVGEFVTVAMAQHQAQLDAWNKVLTAAGSAAVTEPDATLKPTVDAEFAKVTDVAGAAKLALMLEQIASATYLNAQNVLTDKDAIQLAGSIQIIDAQHAAVLLFVLGEYPVPDVFAKVEMAAG